tara:strand:- start:5 stop:388 length:384 start_codon:yes stop_codon:yes gene_type:complete
MKTWKELREALNMAQRKAVGRRMAQMAKKKSTQMKKARNKLKPWPKDVVHQKAQKAVRKIVMQKIAGKSKDLSDISIGQKEKLEKAVDKKMKGGKMNAFVKKKEKELQKKHKEDVLKAKEKMKKEKE